VVEPKPTWQHVSQQGQLAGGKWIERCALLDPMAGSGSLHGIQGEMLLLAWGPMVSHERSNVLHAKWWREEASSSSARQRRETLYY
jgi:hypothetical protein